MTESAAGATVTRMSRVPATPWLREDGALVLGGGQMPPAPDYVQVTAETTGIVGHPVVWLDAPGSAWEYGWRVVDGPWEHHSGKTGVTICREAEWWTAALTARKPTGCKNLVADLVWLVAYGDRTPA